MFWGEGGERENFVCAVCVFEYVSEREESVCVCARLCKREYASMCETKRDRVCVCVCQGERERA